MSTVKEMFDDAVRYEESTLAHYIFFQLQEGKVQMDDDQSNIDLSEAYSDKFQNMCKNNFLGFDQIKIYSLKQSRSRFIFIFAKNRKEARELYYQEYEKEPINCMELSPDEIMNFGNRFMTFREIKKEIQVFPCILGYFDKPDLTVRR